MANPTPANSGTSYFIWILARAVLALIDGKNPPAKIIAALRLSAEVVEEDAR